MKKLFLLAWPIALAAVSCSNEEVVSVNNDANEIKFAVTAENATRAEHIFCNINKPTTFHVWAAVGNESDAKQYFANVKYTEGSSHYTAEGGKVHFWPSTGTDVDFYAVTERKNASDYEDWSAPYNGEGTTHAFGWNVNSASTIKWQTRSLQAPSQTDLLYAYTRASRPTGTEGVVDINFRHALSQIVFKAVNTNPTIKVEIDQVEVVNIAESGVFTMPFGATNVTNSNVEIHTPAGSYPTSVGKWDIQTNNTNPTKTYTTTKWQTATVIGSDEANPTNLTEETTMSSSEHAGFNYSLLLIPQKTTAWKQSVAASKDPDATTQKGSYFKVHCKIWNVSGVEGGAGSDLLLWGTNAETTKAVYIPVAANWEPGKKYIYTFKFGSNTTGGFDEDGDPVLIPISFDITVDDFVKVTEIGVPMEPQP